MVEGPISRSGQLFSEAGVDIEWWVRLHRLIDEPVVSGRGMEIALTFVGARQITPADVCTAAVGATVVQVQYVLCTRKAQRRLFLKSKNGSSTRDYPARAPGHVCVFEGSGAEGSRFSSAGFVRLSSARNPPGADVAGWLASLAPMHLATPSWRR